jgi:tetratricopeptide (TPR) repeat protein
MGGFWAVGVVIYLASTIAMLVSFDRKRGAVASLFLLGMLGFVAVLPQSNELRYYMFLPLCWAAAIAMVFPAIRAKAPLVAPAFLAMVLGLFLYMVSENRTYYDIERRGYEQVARDWGATQWWDKLQRAKRYCAVDMMPVSLLLTGPTMTEFSIADRSSEGLCPDDATVLTKTGGQHRKGAIAPGGRGDDDTSAARKAREYVNESLALYTAGKYPEAIAKAAKAIELAPRYAVAYNNLCAAYNGLARWDEGIAACTKAIEFDPGLQLAINNLAHAQRMNDAPELRRARELVAEGLALYNAGKFQESIAVTTRAVALAPRLTVAHNNLCAAYNALAKWDDGIAACTRALGIDPEFQLAKNNLAWAREGATARKAGR